MATLVDNYDYDATDALFNRGSYLRMLREMEAQDDADRAASEEESSKSADSDTLHYESEYLQRQSYYDDLKHINYKYIDFGCIHNSSNEDKENTTTQEPQQARKEPLIIEQDRIFSKGGLVWDAGVILGEHLIHAQAEWKGAVKRTDSKNSKPIRMVELGSGTGITGLMVASAMPEVHMSLTDLPELMPLLQRNLAHNPTVKASAFPLAWGLDVQDDYDVVLAADVVAGIYDPIKLAKTIYDLCHENTVVYLSVNSRLHEIIATFEDAMDKLFECVEHRAPISRNKNPNVSILVATKKR